MGGRRLDAKRLEKGLGKRVGDLRRGYGWTQAEMATRLRCTIRYVAQIEAGRNVTLHTLVRLASVLEVEPYELLQPPLGMSRSKRGRPRKAPSCVPK